jgi:hypothetical protein
LHTPFNLSHCYEWTGMGLLILSLLWMSGELLLASFPQLRVWLPLIVTVIAIQLPYYPKIEHTQWLSFDETLRDKGAFDEKRTYVGFQWFCEMYSDHIYGIPPDRVGPPIARYGDTPRYASLRFVNGYSALNGPRGYDRLFDMTGFGSIEPPLFPSRIVSVFAAPGGLLRRMGVDGIVVGPAELPYHAQLLEDYGWKCATKTNDGAIFHRDGPAAPRVWSSTDVEWMKSLGSVLDRLAESTQNLPNLLVADPGVAADAHPNLAKAEISEVRENRLSVRCKVSNPSDQSSSVVGFARAFYPGYRAFLNGDELPVKIMNGVQVAVILPPGARGELYLVFASKLLVLEWGLALGAILVISGCLIGPWRNRSRGLSPSAASGTGTLFSPRRAE